MLVSLPQTVSVFMGSEAQRRVTGGGCGEGFRVDRYYLRQFPLKDQAKILSNDVALSLA